MGDNLIVFALFLQLSLIVSTGIILIYSRACAAAFALFDKNKHLLEYLPISFVQQNNIKDDLATQRAYIVYLWLPLAFLAMCNVALYTSLAPHVENPINWMAILTCFTTAGVIVRASSCQFDKLNDIAVYFMEATYRKGIAEVREQANDIPRIAIDLKCTEEELHEQAAEIIATLEEKIAEIRASNKT